MRHFKLLPLPLLISLSSSIFADPISLPTISVEGITAEATPYALPAATSSSPDTGALLKRLPGANINNNGAITSIPQYRGLFGNRINCLVPQSYGWDLI